MATNTNLYHYIYLWGTCVQYLVYIYHNAHSYCSLLRAAFPNYPSQGWSLCSSLNQHPVYYNFWCFILNSNYFSLFVYCLPLPLNDKLIALGSSSVDTEIVVNENEWMTNANYIQDLAWCLARGVWAWMSEWIKGPWYNSTTHPPSATFADVLS